MVHSGRSAYGTTCSGAGGWILSQSLHVASELLGRVKLSSHLLTRRALGEVSVEEDEEGLHFCLERLLPSVLS